MQGIPQKVKMEEMPAPAVISQRAEKVVAAVFAGKKPPTGRKPIAIVTLGVQGAGKSTAIRRRTPPSFVQIDPDNITNILLRHGPLPNGGPVYSLSDEWTNLVVRHALRWKYDFVLDSAFPSRRMLDMIKSRGYRIEMLLVRATRSVARVREVNRDLRRGWGRPGLSLRSHRSTRDRIAQYGPPLANKFADTLTVCDNNGAVMRCMKQPSVARAAPLFEM